MKKYILLSMVTLGSAACTDSFLKEEMVATITQDYFNTEQGFEQLIVGTYDAWRVSKQYQQGVGTTLYGLDNVNASNSSVSSYSTSQWNSTTDPAALFPDALAGEFSSNSLLGYYPIINNCNRAIATIRNGEALGKFASDTDYANLRMSEALVNRAYCIYILNTMYGDVYFPREYTKAMPENFAFPRETSENIYQQIIGDLRFAYEHLPSITQLNIASDLGRDTKEAAAHFLAKLYLQRAQAANYGTAAYGRNADGSIDTSNSNAYLGLLYKGNVSTDLDSCIYFANQVIDGGYHKLSDDYYDWFKHLIDDYSNESNPEIIQSCVYARNTDNGRYGARLVYSIGTDYRDARYGIPDFCWEYPGKSSARLANASDFGMDVYTNKHADSRYQKGFWIEYKTALNGGGTAVPGPNQPYYAYDSEENITFTWTSETAEYFNNKILPNYDRESWGGRRAVEGQHRMGTDDLAYVFVENTKETAIDIEEALAQPFVVRARWIKDGNKFYYRVPIADGADYEYKTGEFRGLESSLNYAVPMTRKYDDPNRNQYNDLYTYRDIAIFRIGETYLLRAEAYGRKGQYDKAIDDINKVRERAAFKPGETRAEVLARLQPGHENLKAVEKQWPYTVVDDMSASMRIDASYWDGSSANSVAESYPPEADTNEKRFQNFILNELARELSFEMIYWENLHHSGWQYDRVKYNNQMAADPSVIRWDTSDNLVGNTGQNGKGKSGFYKPGYTFKAFKQALLNMLTDENNNLLDEGSKKAYQNPDYN